MASGSEASELRSSPIADTQIDSEEPPPKQQRRGGRPMYTPEQILHMCARDKAELQVGMCYWPISKIDNYTAKCPGKRTKWNTWHVNQARVRTAKWPPVVTLDGTEYFYVPHIDMVSCMRARELVNDSATTTEVEE